MVSTSQAVGTPTTPVKWHLHDLLHRHKIRGSELARVVKRSGNSIYGMKNRSDMPRLTGWELGEILAALNQLADPSTLSQPITINDLLSWDGSSVSPLSPEKLEYVRLR